MPLTPQNGFAPGFGRVDFVIEKEARVITLASRDLAGRQRPTEAERERDFDQFVTQRVIDGVQLCVPQGISQLHRGCGVGVRVVVGELSAEESSEWIGRVAWKLRIPSGILVLDPGWDFLDAGDESSAILVEVPPGDYAVSMCSTVTSSSAMTDLAVAQHCHPARIESIGRWYRRTRPNAILPDWLQVLCVLDPKNDPGNEAHWRTFNQTAAAFTLAKRWHDRAWVDVLVHLERIASFEAAALPVPVLNGGSATELTECRKAELCPLGLPLNTSG